MTVFSAGFIIDACGVYSDQEQVDACLCAWQEKVSETQSLCSTPVLSFRTCINGLAFVFKCFARAAQLVVFSSSSVYKDVWPQFLQKLWAH